jgi:hypothetical protein
MIGLKIALTGIILLAVGDFFVKVYGSKKPGIAMLALFGFVFLAGLSAVVGGLIYSIWS